MPGKERFEAFPIDGDHIVDNAADISADQVVTRKFGWAFPLFPPTPVVRLRGQGLLPHKKWSTFLYPSAPTPLEWDTDMMGMDGVIDTVIDRAATGRDQESKRRAWAVPKMQLLALCISGAFLLMVGLWAINKEAPMDPSPRTIPAPITRPADPSVVPTRIFDFTPSGAEQ